MYCLFCLVILIKNIRPPLLLYVWRMVCATIKLLIWNVVTVQFEKAKSITEDSFLLLFHQSKQLNLWTTYK